MGIPLSSHLADYPHAENSAEMVTKRTFEGWEAAMERLKDLRLLGEELVHNRQVYFLFPIVLFLSKLYNLPHCIFQSRLNLPEYA